MPRHYVKKTSGPRYTPDDLQNALLEVEKGSSVYAAAKKHGVPEQTVRRWVNQQPSHAGPGRKSFLTTEEEKCIVVALQFLGKCGFPFDRRDVLNLVESYLTKNKNAQKLFANGKPGIEWVRGFEDRWKHELGKRKAEILTKARAADLNEETTSIFFNQYEKLLIENDLLNDPDRIFNLDEVGLSTDSRSSKVFLKKNQRTAYLKSADCGKAMYTVLFCVSATGTYCPPFVVYKGQHLYESWTVGGPPGTLYGCSESGWMQDSLFESWMECFANSVKKVKKPVLLIYDGHGSHLTYNTAKLAMDNEIIIFCLPPNCSHALQPLDVGVFSPMKKVWRDILKDWYRESRLQNVTKASFPFLLKKVFEKMKPQNAVSGFKGSGLYPLNKNAINHRILVTEKTDQEQIPGSTTSKESQISLDSPLKDLKQAILHTLSPPPSANTVLAMANSTRKRKRVQKKCGEVLTTESVLERLAAEESDRKLKSEKQKLLKKKCIDKTKINEKEAGKKSKKIAAENLQKEKENSDVKEIKQGSWVEVEYNCKRQNSKFIGQVIDIDELYHVKYLSKSKIGNYYTFPEIDDDDYVEQSSICRKLEEPNFDNRGHYFFS